MCSINTKSWNQPVSGVLQRFKFALCCWCHHWWVIGPKHYTPPLQDGWATALTRVAYDQHPIYNACLIFTCNYSCSKWWYFRKRSWYSLLPLKDLWIKHHQKKHRLKMSTSVTPDPSKKKKTRGLIEESKSVTKVSNLSSFGPLICAVGCSCWGSPKEIIQINAHICDMIILKKGMIQ